MSYGLCCLNCRRYIGNGRDHCKCADPVPTWDLKSETNDPHAVMMVGRMLTLRDRGTDT